MYVKSYKHSNGAIFLSYVYEVPGMKHLY